MKKIGKLKLERISRGLSLKEMSEKTGLSPMVLSKYENSKFKHIKANIIYSLKKGYFGKYNTVKKVLIDDLVERLNLEV